MKHLKHPAHGPRTLYSRNQQSVIDSKSAWGAFRDKEAVHTLLISAQNHLCSYCEIELLRGADEIGYHIEHIQPKSIYPNLTFDFNNLLISCFNTGNEFANSTYDIKSISCGHAKKNVFDANLFIKPTDSNCEEYFHYELDGRIVGNPRLDNPKKAAQANYTIEILNLNCRRLKRERRDMIAEGLGALNTFLDDSDSRSRFCELELATINDKKSRFFTTRRQYFQCFIK